MPDIRNRPKDKPVVFIVDDDPSMQEALMDLFLSMSFQAQAFESASVFLAEADFSRHGCILLDVRLPGVSGIDFQGQLERIGNKMPIVFMTGFGDIPMSVRAMKAGAVDFLTKPFKDQDILDAVATAIDRDMVRRQQNAQNDAVTS
ncbi:response regulator transcription factor, partial [Phyllobacterium sp. P5_D12]